MSITMAHDDLPDDIEEVTLSSQKRKLWESKSNIDEETLHNELRSGPRPQDDNENATTSAEVGTYKVHTMMKVIYVLLFPPCSDETQFARTTITNLSRTSRK